jgi:hypothetical protein
MYGTSASKVVNSLSMVLVACGCILAIAACGSSRSRSGSGSKTFAQGVRYSDCMRSHGVSNFPDPAPGGGFDVRARGHSLRR